MGALVVERMGAGVVVRAEDARAPVPPPPFTLADGRTQVYVDETALPVFERLEPEVLTSLRNELRPEGVGLPAIRLLSSRAGLAARDGSRPLALRLSEALATEVVAPDGELLMLPGGELFSAGEQTGWVGFRPGRSKLHDGPRYPIPDWQDGLSTSLRTRPIDPRISVTPIPAGIWVRAAGQPPRPHGDTGYQVPLSRNRLAIVVGAPGEPLPATEALAAFVGGLPASQRETFGLIGYGPEPVSIRPLAQQLAELIGQPVHGCHAVPQYLPESAQTWVVPDGSGQPSWLPFVLESTYQPGVPPTPRNWLPPVPGLAGAGTGTFWLQDGWLIDVLPAGLLVRPVRVPVDPVASRLPISPDAVNLVVSSAGGAPPERVLTAVERLAADLPAEVRERLRLIATPHVGPDYLGRLAASLNVAVHVLGAAGPGPAVEVVANAPLGAHPWEASTGMMPAGIAGQSVAWVPAPPAGVPAAEPVAPVSSAAQQGQRPAAPGESGAGENQPAAAVSATQPMAGGPIRHQPTEPLRIVSPVVVDAEGRMRPTGDGWHPGEPGAAGQAVAVADVPPVPASLGSASTPLPHAPDPQPSEKPEEETFVEETPRSKADPTAQATPVPAANVEPDTPAAAATTAEPGNPSDGRAPVAASAIPTAVTSVQIPAVASSTPLPSMTPATREPAPEPAAPSAEDTPPVAPPAPDPPPPAARTAARTAGPGPGPRPPATASAARPAPPARPTSAPAPAAAAAATQRMPAPVVPAAPALPAPAAPPVHAPTPVKSSPAAAVQQRPASGSAVAAARVPTAAASADPAVTQAVPAPAEPTTSAVADGQVPPADAADARSAADRTTRLNLAAVEAAVEAAPTTEDSANQQGAAAAEQVSTIDVAAEGAEVVAEEAVGSGQAETDEQVAAAALKPLLLVDHSSTEEDRQQFKKSLGWKYDAATRSVTRLLAERPGLRGGMPVDDAMLTELAAVHVFATSDQRQFVDAIRSGDAASQYPFISCLAGGLRRLPSLQGLVVRGGPGAAETVEDYVVGSELVEPAPMLGVSDESADVSGSVELLIWSVTARRLGGLADDENSADVVFPPATSYRVLAVEADSGRVLLTEVGKKQRSEEARKRHDARVLERLTEAAKSRDERGGAEVSAPDHERYSVLLGEPASPFAKPAGVDR